jgi:hypothetical protein
MAHLTPNNNIQVGYDLNIERSCLRKRAFNSEFYAISYRDFLEREGLGYFDYYLCLHCLHFHLYRMKEV